MLKEVKKYYQNSTKLFSLCHIDENNLRQGEYTSWYENGLIREHCFYKDGNLHGEYKSWHENGQLQTLCYYVEDELDGEYKIWYDNGLIRKHCFHKNGMLEGEYKRWHENGQLEFHFYFLKEEEITTQIISLVKDINNITEEEKLFIKLKFGIPLLPIEKNSKEMLC